MQTATEKGPEGIAATSTRELSGADVLISELGVVHPAVFAGVEDDLQADAGEAPSGASIARGDEERRAEMDERIMAGLVRA